MNLFLLGVLLKLSPDIPLQSILRSSSKEAEEINKVTNYFFLAAGFILLIVAGFTAYILYKYRTGRNQPLRTTNKRWEIAMIGIPSLLVAFFLFESISTLKKVNSNVEGKIPDVVITGHQWWWEVSYPGTNVVTANEVHLPAGKKLLLKLLAADVIHDWWIPQFGSKMDMIPNQQNFLWLTIKEPGEYDGICSEFCGPQHAHMRIKVIAQNENDFNTWIQSHRQPAIANNTYNSGAQLFMSKTCSNCHKIDGTGANGNIGPNLTHLASRKTLLAGLLENNITNLENWIRDPQKIKPGAHMPDFLLDDSSVKALSAYLYNLK